MDKEHKEAIQVTKEIVIKFIEMQRISPANFPEMFPAVYKVVQRTIAASADDAPKSD
jgi:predicted transcriptional regulator